MAGTLTVQNLQGPSSGANANKIIVPSGQELHAAGHVVQVKEASTPPVHVTFTSLAYTDIGLSVSITPTSASSKLLILYTCPIFLLTNGGHSAIGGGFRLYRDSVSIDDPQGDGGGPLGNWINLSTLAPSGYWDYFMTHTGNMMDAPNTTSAVNYNVKYSHRLGSSSNIGYDGSNYYPRCRMTVMEVAQ